MPLIRDPCRRRKHSSSYSWYFCASCGMHIQLSESDRRVHHFYALLRTNDWNHSIKLSLQLRDSKRVLSEVDVDIIMMDNGVDS